MAAIPQPTATDVGAMYDEHTATMADVMAGFIHVGYWESLEKPDEPMEIATERMTREVAELLSSTPGQHILDVGCGTGKSAAQIATSYDVQITGVTLSNHQIEVAKAAYDDIIEAGKVNFEFANAMDLPFGDASFDVHMDDRRTALANIARVLRLGGGRLSIADLVLDAGCPNPEAIACWHELFQVPALPSGDDLKNLLHETGFKVLEYTNVRDHIRPICKYLEKKALSLDGEVDEKLLEVARSLEGLKEIGYVFIAAERR